MVPEFKTNSGHPNFAQTQSSNSKVRIDCRHLDEKGICQGKYKGFGCIEDKCQDPTRGPKLSGCKFLRGDGYCKKHGKFECKGEDCVDFED